jgi:putative salt-induced outer membrane protein
MFRKCFLTLATLLVLTSAGTFAQDRVVMKNGDVISGNVSLITDQDVVIEPSYSDAFAVDITEVATVELADAFDIELADDTRLEGRLAVDESGQQLIIAADGATLPFSLTQLAQATEPEDYFDWNLKADLNASYNGGNTDSENTLFFVDGGMKWGDHRHRADLTVRDESVNGTSTQEQTLFNYGYNWIFSDPWFMGGSFAYERDPVRDLEYRYTAGLLIGRDIFDDAKKYLGIGIGPGYSQEKLGDESDGGAVGLWNLRYEHSLLTWVSFFHTQNFTWQYYGNDNSIYKTNTGFSFDLVSDLYFNVSLRYDYETEPAEGRSKDDSTLAFGVGYAF